MSGYRELMRRKLLHEIYDKLSNEDKRLFVQLTIDDKDHREIMSALDELKSKADSNRQSWLSDFGANIAGNAVFDGAVWLVSKLIKKI